MSEDCVKGFEGMCCCNCIHQLRVNCHPMNGNNLAFGFLQDKIKFGHGSILTQLGWACNGLQFEDNSTIVFFDHEHGMCELHERK